MGVTCTVGKIACDAVTVSPNRQSDFAHPAAQVKSGSVRRTGKEDGREYELKPSIVVQRVQLPPGKGQSASRKPALARDSNGSAKRRRAGAKAAGVSLEINQCRSPRGPDSGGAASTWPP